MVTSHAAFGYLAAAYDLRQEAISGVSPESEPDPARLAELAELASEEGVTTIFTEDLVSPEVAEALAADAGLSTAVLSPLEGLTDEQLAAGEGYVTRCGGTSTACGEGSAVPDVAVLPAPVEELLGASGLTFAFGREPVLEAVDLTVRPGEFVALVGPNGSGKSTLLRLLLGSLEPDAGHGAAVRPPAGDVRHRGRLGYVPQRPNLSSELPATVREIVTAGRLTDGRWWLPLTRADRLEVDHAIALGRSRPISPPGR